MVVERPWLRQNIPVKGGLCHWGVMVQRLDLSKAWGVQKRYRYPKGTAHHGGGTLKRSRGQSIGIEDALPYLLARMVLYFLLSLHFLRNGFCPSSTQLYRVLRKGYGRTS